MTWPVPAHPIVESLFAIIGILFSVWVAVHWVGKFFDTSLPENPAPNPFVSWHVEYPLISVDKIVDQDGTEYVRDYTIDDEVVFKAVEKKKSVRKTDKKSSYNLREGEKESAPDNLVLPPAVKVPPAPTRPKPKKLNKI
jgi:hypothetical protein